MAAVKNNEKNSNDSDEAGDMDAVTADLLNVFLLSMEQESFEQHKEKLCKVIDDDVVSDDDLLEMLFVKLNLQLCADDVDGVSDQRICEVQKEFNNDQLRAKNAHWLLLSSPTKPMEEEQREHEINHFVTKCNLPQQQYVRIKIMDLKELSAHTLNFLQKHKGTDYHLNIVILGHGSAQHGTVASKKTGALATYAAGGLGVQVESHNLVKVVEDHIVDLTKQHGVERKGYVHLCLFYCFAQHANFGEETNNLKVILYRNGEKNPKSLFVPIKDDSGREIGIASARHLGLRWFLDEWKKMEEGEAHNLSHGVSATAQLMNQGQSKGTQTEDVVFAPTHLMNQGQNKGTQTEDDVYAAALGVEGVVQSESDFAAKAMDVVSRGGTVGPAGISLRHEHVEQRAAYAAAEGPQISDDSAGDVADDTKGEVSDGQQVDEKPVADSLMPNLDCKKFSKSSTPLWRKLWNSYCDYISG